MMRAREAPSPITRAGVGYGVNSPNLRALIEIKKIFLYNAITI